MLKNINYCIVGLITSLFVISGSALGSKSLYGPDSAAELTYELPKLSYTNDAEQLCIDKVRDLNISVVYWGLGHKFDITGIIGDNTHIRVRFRPEMPLAIYFSIFINDKLYVPIPPVTDSYEIKYVTQAGEASSVDPCSGGNIEYYNRYLYFAECLTDIVEHQVGQDEVGKRMPLEIATILYALLVNPQCHDFFETVDLGPGIAKWVLDD